MRNDGEATRRRTRTWGVILGVSAGTGAAIARAVARDPGLDIHGVHRGKHPAGAAAVEVDAAAAGARAVIRISDAGTAEGALMGAADLLALAGPRSVRFFVHSIANHCAALCGLPARLGATP
jgi:hypothetical protein